MEKPTLKQFTCTDADCELTTESAKVAMTHAGDTGHTLTALLDEGTTVTVSLATDDEDDDWDDEV